MLIQPIVFYILSTLETVYDSRNHEYLVCLKPGCIKAAAQVLSNIDVKVDPCEDFYRFACGGWMNRYEDTTTATTFDEAQDDVNSKLGALMEKKLDGSEPPFVKMVKELYDTCLDEDAIDEAGAEPLKKNIKSLGGWPVVVGDYWEDYNFDWIQVLASLRKLGYSHDILLHLSVVTDYRNKTVHILQLDETSRPLRKHLIRGLNDSVTADYFKLMVQSAKLLGADEKTAENELIEALQFEIALANFTSLLEERRNISNYYNKYTVKELQEAIPQIPWLKYFNGLLNDEIHENETLIVSVPEFVKHFAELISQTDTRAVANYMVWTAVEQSTSYLSRDWRDLRNRFYSVLYGERYRSRRWHQCFYSVTGNLGIALSSYYVRQYFKEETKHAVLELVEYIRKELLNILEKSDWMDKKTKQYAIAKANNMKAYIGYPAELLNDTAILEYYQNLTITKESHFQNIMRIRKWSTDYKFSRLRKPSIRGDWTKHGLAMEVNAFYEPEENSIVIPAGILHDAFFNKDRPHYMNFAGIGEIIGHEITHGFDDLGRQYDKDGNNVNWWEETTDKKFKTKVQCIIDQYNNYITEDGVKVNGVNTQGENIADNGGLKEAYQAYHSWVKDNGHEQLLPGVDYTQSQLFWISAASKECEKWRPDSEEHVYFGSYSPTRYRVNGPLSNLKEFAKDFKCSPDSPMNKQPKCQVW